MTVTLTRAAAPTDFRQRKKLETMRHVQLTALGLFEAQGFDAVTIDDVARAALVSAPTIYRHFGTKEGLVLWDEYDPLLLRTLTEHLEIQSEPLGDAIREALVRPLDRVYAAEASRILRRVSLVEGHPGLRAAVAANLPALRSEMAHVLLASGACQNPLESDVVAGATIIALEVAIEHWALAGGKRPLRHLIEKSLRRLCRFAETTTASRARMRDGAR